MYYHDLEEVIKTVSVYNKDLYFGIPEFLDFGHKSWTLDSGRWNLDPGLWTLDSGYWTLNAGLRTLDPGRWTLDARLRTLESGR